MKYGFRESGLWEFSMIEIEVVRGPERVQKRRWAEGESLATCILLSRWASSWSAS